MMEVASLTTSHTTAEVPMLMQKEFFCPQQRYNCVSKAGISLSVARGILSLLWRQCEALFLCSAWNKKELRGEPAKARRGCCYSPDCISWLSHANDTCRTQRQLCSVPYGGSSAAQTIRGCESQEKQKLLLSSEWRQHTAQYRMRSPKGICLKGIYISVTAFSLQGVFLHGYFSGGILRY